MNNTVLLEDYFSVYFSRFLRQDEGIISNERAENDPRNLFARALRCLRRKELDEAMALLLQAAESGHAQAAFGMGICKVLIAQVQKSREAGDYADAAMWLSYAADLGLVEAMVALAFFHLAEDNPLYNLEHSALWFQRAAEAGDTEGIYEYGCCFLSGQGVEQDFVQAAYWFEKGAAMDDTMSQFELGVQYMEGEGVEKDIARAVSLFEKAVEKNHPGAMAALAQLYYTGEGLEKDYNKAYELYFKCYKLGNPKGNLGLARMYLDNEAIACDWQTALQLLSTDAAENFQHTRQLKSDMLEQLTEGMKKGDVFSCVQLGWAMLNGHTYTGDKAKAFSLISMAARKADPLARCLLRCYFGDQPNPNTAGIDECAEFFRTQMEHGQAWAARELLLMVLRDELEISADETSQLFQQVYAMGDLSAREFIYDREQKENARN